MSRGELVSESNYHTTKWFSENLLAIEMKTIKVKMNKPVYLITLIILITLINYIIIYINYINYLFTLFIFAIKKMVYQASVSKVPNPCLLLQILLYTPPNTSPVKGIYLTPNICCQTQKSL